MGQFVHSSFMSITHCSLKEKSCPMDRLVQYIISWVIVCASHAHISGIGTVQEFSRSDAPGGDHTCSREYRRAAFLDSVNWASDALPMVYTVEGTGQRRQHNYCSGFATLLVHTAIGYIFQFSQLRPYNLNKRTVSHLCDFITHHITHNIFNANTILMSIIHDSSSQQRLLALHESILQCT